MAQIKTTRSDDFKGDMASLHHTQMQIVVEWQPSFVSAAKSVNRSVLENLPQRGSRIAASHLQFDQASTVARLVPMHEIDVPAPASTGVADSRSRRTLVIPPRHVSVVCQVGHGFFKQGFGRFIMIFDLACPPKLPQVLRLGRWSWAISLQLLIYFAYVVSDDDTLEQVNHDPSTCWVYVEKAFGANDGPKFPSPNTRIAPHIHRVHPWPPIDPAFLIFARRVYVCRAQPRTQQVLSAENIRA